MTTMTLLQILADAGAAIGKMGAGIGAGLGISRIGSSTMEAMARQPEIAGDARSSMILSAAFIEGVALFAIVVCLLIAIAK